MYCPKIRVIIHLLQRLQLKGSEKITLEKFSLATEHRVVLSDFTDGHNCLL